MSEDDSFPGWYYGSLWDQLFRGNFTNFTPTTYIHKEADIGTILRNLIKELEAAAKELDQKEQEFEADITMRINGKIYSIEIKSVASAEENNSDVSEEDSSMGV